MADKLKQPERQSFDGPCAVKRIGDVIIVEATQNGVTTRCEMSPSEHLGLSPAELGGIEHGRLTFATDDDWAAAERLLDGLEKGRP